MIKQTLILVTLINSVFVQAADKLAEYLMSQSTDAPFSGPLNDWSGNNRHGQVYGPKFTTSYWSDGDGAYWFSGKDEYLQLPAKDYTGFTGDFMISFYEKSCALEQKVALALEGETQKSIVFSFDSSNVGSQVTLNGKTYNAGKIGEFTDGRYHHVLLRRAGDNVELFIDLKKQWSQTIKGSIGIASDFRVSGDIHPWLGAIDDITIFQGAMNDGEISTLAWGGQTIKPKGPWQLMTCDAEFKRRDGLGALVFKDKMWLLGGWNPSPSDGHYNLDGVDYGKPENQISFPGPDGDSQEVWSSTDGKNWKFEVNAPWEQRHMAGWAVFKGKIWIVGGDNNNLHIQKDLWSSVDGINWVDETSKGPFGWEGRILHHVEVFKDKIWVMGGQSGLTPNAPEQHLNDVWSSEDGIHWNLVTKHAAWSPRGAITGSAVFQNKMWIVAGGVYGEKFFNDVWNTTDGKIWTKVKQPTPAYFPPRYYHDIHVLDGKLWLIGGFDPTGNLNDVYFTEDGKHWTEVANTDWGGRHALGVWVYKKSLYVGAGNLWNDVWRLTPSSTQFKSLKIFYRDRDLDGFGDKNYPVLAKQPSLPGVAGIKFVNNKSDCDDSDINKHPAYSNDPDSVSTCP